MTHPRTTAAELVADPSRLTLTVEEAGTVLGISRAAAYRLLADGTLPVLDGVHPVRVSRRLLLEQFGL